MPSPPRRVRKRDGREVPFDARKISAAIFKAIRATGGDDERLASELAEVVAITLGRRGPKPVPGIEEIQDLVERVLMETGHAPVAKAYILYRDRRARIREMLAVRRESPEKVRSPAVLGDPRETLEPWTKGKIVAALLMEADLPREVAETVAGRVEERVFDSGLRRISTSLVRELVDNELFALGLGAKLRRQTLVGVPKYDLSELLRTGFSREEGVLRAPGGEAERSIASGVLARFAIEEVFPGSVADRHLAGDLHLPAIGAPHRFAAAGVLLPSLLAGAFGTPATGRSPASSVARPIGLFLADLLRGCTGPVAIDGLEEVFRERGGPDDLAETLLLSVSLLAASTGAEIGIHLDRPDSTAAQALFRAALAAEPPHPRFVLHRGSSWPAEGNGAAPASLAGSMRLAWDSPEERYVGRGLRRLRGEERHPLLFSGAGAVLNLPRLAYRTGRWNEGGLLERAFEMLDVAVEACGAHRDFLAASAAARGASFPAARPMLSVGAVGLAECVRFACGGEFDPRLARTLVAALADGARAKGEERGMRIAFDLEPQPSARSRFARLDADRFAEAAEFSRPEGVEYSDGWTFPASSGILPGGACGLLASALAAGAVPYPDGRAEAPASFLLAFDRARQDPESAVPSPRGLPAREG